MLLNIPFYENKGDGNQCMQVAMQSVLKYFLNKEYSLEELDKLTRRKAGFWTWTSQIVPVLHNLSLTVKYYANTDLQRFLEGEKYIQKHYGKDADKILKYSDVPVIIKAIRKVLNHEIFEKKKLRGDEIEAEIKNGCIPLMLIDDNKIRQRQGFYQTFYRSYWI